MCVNPIVLFQKRDSDGKKRSHYAFQYVPEVDTPRLFRRLSFKASTREHGKYIVVGCGKCCDCLRQRINEWKTRLTHHLIENRKCIFLTLTYDDEHMFDNEGNYTSDLDYSHFQNFMRSLRREFPDADISYFVAGEYGVNTLRRHFHALIFGIDRKDLQSTFFCVSRRDHKIKEYISPIISDLWDKGFHFISSVDPIDTRCIGYVTGYMYGKMSKKHLSDVANNRSVPEFHHMSLKRPIGKSYFLKRYKQIIENGFCYASGKKCSIPRAYVKWYRQLTSKFKFVPLFQDCRFVKKCENICNGLDTSEILDMDYYFENLYDGTQFFVDIKTDYDTIRSRRMSEFFRLASTGKITTQSYISKRIILESRFKFTRD